MGKKVSPLIFKSLIFKNYVNNFYININKNKFYYLNKILIVYYLYYNLYKFHNFNKKNNNINIVKININFFIKKFNIILFIYNNNKDFINLYDLKYIFVFITYINFYYYSFYKICYYLQIKYFTIIDINLIVFYIKMYYIKYKSFKLLFKFLHNNILIKHNIKGLKVRVSGRFKNSLKTKTEMYIFGVLSLSTLDNNIKYINDTINTKRGVLGIKVWLNN